MSSRRFLEVASGVWVHTSDVYMTNTTLVVSGDRCLLIDPGLLPADLAVLEEEIAQRGLRVEAGVATHAHWDHVLWSGGLGAAPRFATQRTIATLERYRSSMVEGEIRSAGERWYVRWDMSLVGRLTAAPSDTIPWSGPLARLVEHDGHAPGHSAVFFPELGVLAAGDMLSDLELPGIDWEMPDPLRSYLRGLEALAALTGVRVVIPGHGHLGDGAAFSARLEADRRYCEVLAAGERVDDPRLDGWPAQQEAHEANVKGAGSLQA